MSPTILGSFPEGEWRRQSPLRTRRYTKEILGTVGSVSALVLNRQLRRASLDGPPRAAIPTLKPRRLLRSSAVSWYFQFPSEI